MLFGTKRLIIRKWQPADASALYECCSDPNVTKYLSFPTYCSIQDAHDRIADMQRRYDAGDKAGIDYAITLKDGGAVIGSIGLNQYNEKYGRSMEIGYLLNPKHQRKGYMTEVLIGLFKHIKKNDIAWRIVAKHDTTNEKSGAVMRRAGMTFEGIARKGTSNHLNNRADAATYSILVEEVVD